MKAVRIHEFGGPDVLTYEDVDDPEPGEGQVRLKIHACALNHVDIDVVGGVSRFPIEFPLILGLEIVGTVDKLGPGADGTVAEGDRVMPYLLGGEVFLGVAGPGGYAEYVTCPPEQLVPIPEGIDWVDAAALQVPFGTSWHMLFTRGDLRIGETVLINSVSSGTSTLCLEATNNTLTRGGGFFDFNLNQTGGSTFNVADFPNLSGNNNGASLNTTGTITNVLNCP